MLHVAYAPVYRYSLPEGHRFPMVKYELLPEQLLHEGTLSDENFFHPDQFSREQLLLTHTSEYLDKLESLTLSRKEERAIGFPVMTSLVERGKYIACGTYQCALFSMEKGIAMNIAGGTHHAFADKGGGFCLYNDIALAAHNLLSENRVSKILIIDLDVHQGDGSAHIFQSDPRVFTLSFHGKNNYPLRKQTSDLDVELPDGCTDGFYLGQLANVLPGVMDIVRPELVFYLSGVDVLDSDKLGRLSLTREGCRKRDRFVLGECKSADVPVAVVMGGGYSTKISDIVEAHANTFRIAQEIYF